MANLSQVRQYVDGDIGFKALDAYLNPSLLQAGVLSAGVNMEMRGGVLKPRRSFSVCATWPKRTIWACGLWSLESGDRVVVVAEDRIMVVDSNGAMTTLPYNAQSRHFTAQADEFFVIASEHSSVRLAYKSGRVEMEPLSGDVWKAAGPCAYAHGRLFMVPRMVPKTDVDGRRFIIAGDVLTPSDPSRIFMYTEGEFLAGGGAIGLPAELGTIKALAVLQGAQNRATQLVVFARHGVSQLAVSVPRAQWGEVGISNVILRDTGAVEFQKPLELQHDVIYRADDGWRLLSYDTETERSLMASSPFSLAVSRYMGPPVNPSAGMADNVIVVTDGDTNRVCAYDVGVLGGFGVNGGTWLGMWSLPWTIRWIGGMRGGALLGVAESEKNGMLIKSEKSVDREAVAVCVTRSYTCNAPFDGKRLYSVDMIISTSAPVRGHVLFEPDLCGRFFSVGPFELPSGFAGMLRIPVQGRARRPNERTPYLFTQGCVAVVFQGECTISSIRIYADGYEPLTFDYAAGDFETGQGDGEGYTIEQVESGAML